MGSTDRGKPSQRTDSLGVLKSAVDQAAQQHQAKQGLPDSAGRARSKAKPTAKPEPVVTEPLHDTSGTFYVYTDDSGTEHIVDSYRLVPKKHRKTAKKWVMDSGDERGVHETPKEGIAAIAETVKSVTTPRPTPTAPQAPIVFHAPSFLLGLILGAVFFLTSFVFKKRTKLLLKAVLVVVLFCIAGGAYFGWVRRQAGLSSRAVAEPTEIIRDARKATHKLENRMQKERRRLDNIAKDVDQEFEPED